LVAPGSSDKLIEKATEGPVQAFSIMTQTKIAASPKATAQELAFYMTLAGFSGIPIASEDGTIVGIVSEQDIIRLLNRATPLESVSASEVMTSEVMTVDFDTSLEQILRIFDQHHFLLLPVVHEGKLAGMVSRADALRAATHGHFMAWVA
jgi:CBS domain-containing protein